LPSRKVPQRGLGVFPFHLAMESAPPGKFAPGAGDRGACGSASFTAAVRPTRRNRIG
jgi:hypothetical protein